MINIKSKFILCLMGIIVLSLILSSCKKANNAVYILPKGGGLLSQDELKQHPEVVCVDNFDDLKRTIEENRRIAIWIDKNAVDLIDQDWFKEEPQKYYPIVLMGYNNGDYSFRKILHLHFDKKEPDWDNIEVKSGFSVWMERYKEQGRSATVTNCDDVPTVEEILKVTNELLSMRLKAD